MSMEKHMKSFLSCFRLGRASVALLAVAAIAHTGWADPGSSKREVRTYRSPSGITTEIRQKTTGTLSDKDREHVATLGLSAMHYVRDARNDLDAGSPPDAKADIDKALKMLTIVRQLLPKTTITTHVVDAEGQVLHDDTRELELAEVPLDDVSAEIDILRPLQPGAKSSNPPGRELVESDVVETSLSLNIGYVERRLHEAQRSLTSDPDRADEALQLALLDGIVVSTDRFEDPMLEVRDALWYAHRAITSRQYPEAQANLNEARKALATYTAMAGESNREELNSLSQEIADVQQQIAHPAQRRTSRVHGAVERALQRMLHLFGRGTTTTTPQAKAPTENR